MDSIIISEQHWIDVVENKSNWQKWRKRIYSVKIQKAVKDKIYNVPGKKGVIYNFLEDCEQSLENAAYIVTGLAGEIWPITEKDLSSYDVNPEEIGIEPKEFYTRPNGKEYFGIQIPAEILFSVETKHFGVLHGNARVNEISHGEGDYILCTSFESENFRIVNGHIFDKMYELVE